MPLDRRLFIAALLTGPAWAQPASSLDQLRLSRGDEGLRLAYSARLELPRVLDEALHKGVPLYFVAEVRLTRERWYWRDAVVAADQRQWRLTYQALTRQYRLSTGGLHQSFDGLAQALAPIARASGWPLTLREEPQAGADYQLNFRLRLDTAQLPGPLQIGLGPGAALALSREQDIPAAELLPSIPPPTPPSP